LYDYLKTIESEVDGLNKTDNETIYHYNDRLNNKMIFKNVIQMKKNIDFKK